MMRLGQALRRSVRTVVAIGLATGGITSLTQPARADATPGLISGSGSTWASNAVNQWIADVSPQGLQVIYSASGSAQGRRDFANNANDFALSDIGFQGIDPPTGVPDTSGGRAYAYMPLVAGGTAFPYRINVGGQRFQSLRLSGRTLAKIFTNQITSWADPRITADDNGIALPATPIIPVVNSEGSGATAAFTRYLDHEFPDIWQPFYGRPGFTEYFPLKGPPTVAQNGSDGVMNYVALTEGAIAYDEYSYPLGLNFPVAKVENAAGYFTAPTQYNVAIALTQASVVTDTTSPDYLLANLDNVYTYGDPRTYPVSSYSYAIIPTGATDTVMTTAKRQTLADYLAYAICAGQQEAGLLGYSPLTANLVQSGFDQIAKLRQADPNVNLTGHDIANCNNPTFVPGDPSGNHLGQIAPLPPACDRAGQGPCGTLTPTINPQLPTGTVGTPYAAFLTPTGGTPPYTLTVASGGLPPGLNLASASGMVTGTPTAAGTFGFVLHAADSASPQRCIDVPLSITIAPAPPPPPPLRILAHSLPHGRIGSPYAAQLTVQGGTGPLLWLVTKGSLPDGLTLDPLTGVISGTPTDPGEADFTVWLGDFGPSVPQTATRDLSIDIRPRLHYRPRSRFLAR